MKKQPEINDFEREYWRRIHEFNRQESARPKQVIPPAPVREYVLQIFETIKVEG